MASATQIDPAGFSEWFDAEWQAIKADEVEHSPRIIARRAWIAGAKFEQAIIAGVVLREGTLFSDRARAEIRRLVREEIERDKQVCAP